MIICDPGHCEPYVQDLHLFSENTFIIFHGGLKVVKFGGSNTNFNQQRQQKKFGA